MKGDDTASAIRLNPRLSLPAYRFADVARLTETSPQTIARWFRGYAAPGHRMKPVLPVNETTLVSYLQLVEVAFVATFRHRVVELDGLRAAHKYLRETFGEPYPFALWRLRTEGAHVLAEVDAYLIAADLGGQLFWQDAIQQRADEFDYENGLALRWHPRGRNSPILIDPRIAFGAPVVATRGVPTNALKQRYLAGESVEYLADDFGLSPDVVMEALQVEGAVAPAA